MSVRTTEGRKKRRKERDRENKNDESEINKKRNGKHHVERRMGKRIRM